MEDDGSSLTIDLNSASEEAGRILQRLSDAANIMKKKDEIISTLRKEIEQLKSDKVRDESDLKRAQETVEKHRKNMILLEEELERQRRLNGRRSILLRKLLEEEEETQHSSSPATDTVEDTVVADCETKDVPPLSECKENESDTEWHGEEDVKDEPEGEGEGGLEESREEEPEQNESACNDENVGKEEKNIRRSERMPRSTLKRLAVVEEGKVDEGKRVKLTSPCLDSCHVRKVFIDGEYKWTIPCPFANCGVQLSASSLPNHAFVAHILDGFLEFFCQCENSTSNLSFSLSHANRCQEKLSARAVLYSDLPGGKNEKTLEGLLRVLCTCPIASCKRPITQTRYSLTQHANHVHHSKVSIRCSRCTFVCSSPTAIIRHITMNCTESTCIVNYV